MKTYNTMKRIFTTAVTVIMCASVFAQVKIDNNNNLGIGTVNPSARLHVVGTSLVSGNSYVEGHSYGIDGTFYGDFRAANGVFSDNVGIGTMANSAFNLQVAGNSYFYNNMGIGIAPNTTDRLLVSGGALKIGNSNSSTDLAQNMLKIGDGDNIQIGEWEADNMLSFKAANYNFTGGNVGIGVQPATDAKLRMQNASLYSMHLTNTGITQGGGAIPVAQRMEFTPIIAQQPRMELMCSDCILSTL